MRGQPGKQTTQEDLDEERRREDQLDNWPIIPSAVPGNIIGMVERWRLETAVEQAVDYIRKEIQRLGIKDPAYVDRENGVQYKFLIDTMLKYSRTPEQIMNMVNGYIAFCARESGQFRNPLLDSIGNRYHDGYSNVRIIDQSFSGPQKMNALEGYFGEKKYRSLDKYARNPVLHTVTHGLAKEPVYRYGNEPFYDGAYFMMADPTSVDHDGLDSEDTVVERKVPENKRMTKEKLARLLQFPNLEDFIIADRDMAGPAIGSNLAIIAEYFCENNSAIYLNEIGSKELGAWLSEKFAKYNPPLEVAYYVWARFQQTEFEGAASFIETYLTDFIAKNHPWLFEAAGVSPNGPFKPGQIFEIYIAALQKLQEDPNDPNYHKLLEIIPAREIALPFTKSKNPEYRKSVEIFLKEFKVPAGHITREYTREKFIEDPTQMFIDILNEKEVSLEEWKGHEGFELLDPFAISGIKGSLRSWAVSGLQQNVLKTLDQMSLTDLFVFRNTVAEKVKSPTIKTKVNQIIAIAIDKAYAEAISKELSTPVLVDMVRGKEVDLGGVIPVIASLPPELRRAPSSGSLPYMAEAALLSKHFAGARGGDEIVKYLLAQRHSMNPIELIMPFPDAPNLEILKLYKESPNLLLFLSMSTILMYLGYSYDEILAIIEELVEQTETASREELSTIGVELEQVGGVNGKVIATDHFAQLFNVLPSGNDRHCNEILSMPSTSPRAQKALLDIITNPTHGYLDTQALREAEKLAKQPLSSLHINIGLPAGLGLSPMEIGAQVNPIIKATWLAHGGDVQSSMAKGVARRWAHGSLLDVFGNKDQGTKLEIKNAALEEDGSHGTEMDNIFLIASACMQQAKSSRGIKTSNAGAVMAEIFEAFRKEVDRLKFSVDEADSAKKLLAEYASRVKAELNL